MKLATYLKRPGMNASIFSRVIGVAHTTVLRWIDGTMNPPLARMREIERATEGMVRVSDWSESE